MYNREQEVDKFFNLIQVYDIPQYTKIRLGGPNDGGYVVAKEICKKSKALYSFGIGDDISFEKDFLALNPTTKVTCFDPYIDSINDTRMVHIKKGIGVGIENNLHCLDNLMDINFMSSKDSTVKIDVEGNEGRALRWSSLPICNQLIVEFHLLVAEYNGKHSPYFTKMYKEFHHKLNTRHFFEYWHMLSEVSKYYTLYHIHGNNSLPKVRFCSYEFPPLIEMTFINNALIDKKYLSDKVFPTSIDQPNKTDRPDFNNLFPFKVN